MLLTFSMIDYVVIDILCLLNTSPTVPFTPQDCVTEKLKHYVHISII